MLGLVRASWRTCEGDSLLNLDRILGRLCEGGSLLGLERASWQVCAGPSKLSLDFVQSKTAFSRYSPAPLDFVQSGEAFSEISSEHQVPRWIKSILDRGFPVSRPGGWTKSNIGSFRLRRSLHRLAIGIALHAASTSGTSQKPHIPLGPRAASRTAARRTAARRTARGFDARCGVAEPSLRFVPAKRIDRQNGRL